MSELVNGYSERHGAGPDSSLPSSPPPKMVDMKASVPKPAPAPAATPAPRHVPVAATTDALPRVIPASSPSAMLAYEKLAGAVHSHHNLSLISSYFVVHNQ